MTHIALLAVILCLFGTAYGLSCFQCTSPQTECTKITTTSAWPSFYDQSDARCLIAYANDDQWDNGTLPFMQKLTNVGDCTSPMKDTWMEKWKTENNFSSIALHCCDSTVGNQCNKDWETAEGPTQDEFELLWDTDCNDTRSNETNSNCTMGAYSAEGTGNVFGPIVLVTIALWIMVTQV